MPRVVVMVTCHGSMRQATPANTFNFNNSSSSIG